MKLEAMYGERIVKEFHKDGAFGRDNNMVDINYIGYLCRFVP